MENASKALLIAAAVLVTIIIITVGMKIYTSSSGTQKVAMDTGKTLKDKTGEATDLAVGEITNKTKIKYYDSSGNAINKDKLNRGDKIIIGTETFGVLSAVTGKIIAISYYNITLTDSPVQSVSAGTIAFSSEKYWGETTGNIKMDEKDDNGSYKNNIQGYIDKYEKKLKNLVSENIEAKVPTVAEMGGNPFRAFNDIYRSMFWTTTIENYYTNSGNLITTPAPADQIGLSCSGYSDSTKVGVRPIIIVK